MFSRSGRSVEDFLVDLPRAKLSIRAHLRDPDEAHQSVYRRNVKAAGETKISCGYFTIGIGERT